jgi:hypothetical protein
MDWQSLLYGAIPAILGIGFIWARISKVLKAIDEVGDIFELVPKILEDKKISAEEKEELLKELHEAVGALKGILK